MALEYSDVREIANAVESGISKALSGSNVTSRDTGNILKDASPVVSNIFNVFENKQKALVNEQLNSIDKIMKESEKAAFLSNMEFGKQRAQILREQAKLSLELMSAADAEETKLKQKQLKELQDIQETITKQHLQDVAAQKAQQQQLATQRENFLKTADQEIQKQAEEFFRKNAQNMTAAQREEYLFKLKGYDVAEERALKQQLLEISFLREKEDLQYKQDLNKFRTQEEREAAEEAHVNRITELEQQRSAVRSELTQQEISRREAQSEKESQDELERIDRRYKYTNTFEAKLEEAKEKAIAKRHKAEDDWRLAKDKEEDAKRRLQIAEETGDEDSAAKAKEDIADAQAAQQKAQTQSLDAELERITATLIENTIASFSKAVDNAISIASRYTSYINTRLQGTGKSYWSVTRLMEANLSYSPYVQQSKMLENINKLTEAGVAYNLEQRAFLMTISDKIAATFEAANGTLLRLIRLQQADTTAVRAGLVATLNEFLNKMFEDSSYMTHTYTQVSEKLIEASSLMSREQSVEFEGTVQRWLGSLTAVGLSENAVSTIAQAISYLSTGDVTSLANNSSMQTLLAMSASKAGLSYDELLVKSLDSSQTNSLLRGMVEYLKEIAFQTRQNNVVRSAYSNLFSMSVSDFAAISNLTPTDIENIYNTTTSYSEAEQKYKTQVASIFTRLDAASMMENIYENVLYSIGQNIAANPVTNAIWKLNTMVQEATGGINIPSIFAAGFGTDLNTNLNDLIKLGLVGISTLALTPQMIASLGIQAVTGGRGAWLAREYTSRGTPAGVTNTGVTETQSYSGYVGNTDTSDIYSSTVTSANKDAQDLAKTTGAQEAAEEAKTTEDLYDKLFTEQREAILVKIDGFDIQSMIQELIQQQWNVILRNTNADEALETLARKPWD